MKNKNQNVQIAGWLSLVAFVYIILVTDPVNFAGALPYGISAFMFYRFFNRGFSKTSVMVSLSLLMIFINVSMVVSLEFTEWIDAVIWSYFAYVWYKAGK